MSDKTIKVRSFRDKWRFRALVAIVVIDVIGVALIAAMLLLGDRLVEWDFPFTGIELAIATLYAFALLTVASLVLRLLFFGRQQRRDQVDPVDRTGFAVNLPVGFMGARVRR